MLEVINLNINFKELKVLRNINFKLVAGDILAVVGTNGAGKTALITNLATKKNYKSNAGYIPQEIALFEELSVLENFKIFGKINNENKKHFEKIIDYLSLKSEMKKKISKLSGGTKRRVNIGVELVRDPEYIFMDEPIVGIDYEIRKKIVKLIKALSNEGKIILIASHNLSFLEKTCNKLLKINSGTQEYFGEYKNELL